MSADYDVWCVCDDCGETCKGIHEDSDTPHPDEDVENGDKWAVWSIPRGLDTHIEHLCPECATKRGWTVEDNYVTTT